MNVERGEGMMGNEERQLVVSSGGGMEMVKERKKGDMEW